jgi:hypothetical protein
MARSDEPRGKHWCWTLPNPTPQDEQTLAGLTQDPTVKRIIAGYEISEGTGLAHYQGYFELTVTLRRNQVVKMFKRPIHVEPAQGGRGNNVLYCSKGGDVRYRKGLNDKKTGEQRKQEWAEILQDAKTLTPDEFQEKRPRDWILRRPAIERIMIDEANKKCRTWGGLLQSKNVWLWGKTGLGKSRWAEQQADIGSQMKKAVNKWWDGYQVTTTREVIIEDYPERPMGHFLCQHMKIWSDRYAFIGETKGSHVMVEPGKFLLIVTSNFPIDDCFSDQANIDAIKRRFKEIELTEENKNMVAQLRLDHSILAE